MTVEYLTSPDFITRAIICLLFITAYTYCVTRPRIYTFKHTTNKYPAQLHARNWTGIFILSTLCGSRTVCNNCTPGVCRTLAVRPCPARPGSCNNCNIRVRRGLHPHTFPCSYSSKRVSGNGAFYPADFYGKPF